MTRAASQGESLIKKGKRPERLFLFPERWAFRHKLVAGGKRWILAS